MARRRFAVTLVVAVAAGAIGAGAHDQRFRDAATVLTEMSSGGEISPAFLAKARCVAVIPSVKRVAIGLGGQYGRGYISCRNSSGGGWSAPGGVRVEGGSIGFQIGASDSDLILLVMNERGIERLLASRFTVGADAAVAAGPIGRQASAQTDATMMAEILAWSRSRGVYAGISLQGSTLREDKGENLEIYGRELPNKDVVLGGTPVPVAAGPLMTVLGRLR